jgi:hypothetical protein
MRAGENNESEQRRPRRRGHGRTLHNYLHSLFSQVDVLLNGTLITSSINTYAYRAYIETLLSYGTDAKSSQLTSALFYKDEAGKMDKPNPLAANAVTEIRVW